MNIESEEIVCNYDTYIVDTSVIINLHKSNYGKLIIQSLSERLVVTQTVKTELDRIESRIYGTSHFLHQILDCDNVTLVELSSEEEKLIDELTNDKNIPTIDDGEASVIAVGKFSLTGDKCIPVIDESKGRTVAERNLNGKVCGYSINFFFHPKVLSTLGIEKMSDAVYNALMNAKMSIPIEYRQQVIELIGEERARNCKSLPGYKKLFT